MSSENIALDIEKELGVRSDRRTTTSHRAAFALCNHPETPCRLHSARLCRNGQIKCQRLVANSHRESGRKPWCVLAPTGRLPRCLHAWPAKAGYTIHRMIYRQETFRGEGTRFDLGYNKLRNALFIVDEASMIATGTTGEPSVFGSGELLDDLMRYVYMSAGCRLLFVGDTAQLPPVGETESAALSNATLERYGMLVGSADLTEVVRQSHESDVLAGATRIRQLLAEEY